MPDFIPGLELSRRLYVDEVRPLLTGVVHAAALIGPGSEVLGFDTVRSTDHDWGPGVQLFLRHPDTFTVPPDLDGRVTITELRPWLAVRLGFDPLDEITTEDWLAAPTQTLAELTAGAVFHDGLGELASARRKLRWYPDGVWRYVLACQWQRLSEAEPFVGRCAEVGDLLGSAMVAGGLVRDLMRLCLLLARRWPPYDKWLGSAFAKLPCAGELGPLLTMALTDERGREGHLAAAYESVAGLQNALGLTVPVDPTTRPFHDRPFQVLHAERFAEALMATVRDPAIRSLPLTGAVDQMMDNVAVLGNAAARRAAVAAATRRS